MRPYRFLLLISFAFSIEGFANITATHNRNYTPPSDSLRYIPTMESLLISIEVTLNLSDFYEIRAADVNNMEARRIHRKKEILYNPGFVQWINRSTGNKWAAIALIAHEIGHHVLGHTRKKTGSRPSTELEADEFAGKVLRRMGATLSQSQQVMLLIATSQPSKTHPGRLDRLMAIKKGWEEALDPSMASLKP